MGPPIEGLPLSWDDVQRIKHVARQWAVEQLLNIWHKGKFVKDSAPLWGDEVEYTLVHLNSEAARSTVLLDQTRILKKWTDYMAGTESDLSRSVIQPEWASYMLESMPDQPYRGNLDALLAVEGDMKRRRNLIQQFLLQDQHVVSISIFPCLGISDQFTTPHFVPSPTTAHSRMLPREICSPITRYSLLEQNICARRVDRAETHVPIYRDAKTPWPFQDSPPCSTIDQGPRRRDDASPQVQDNCIYLDGVGFGPGSCCVQATFQVENESAARWLYDQLIPLGPVILALTAATPVYKGYLADSDVRWNWISASLDDRTAQEKASLPPRFSSNMTYISEDKRCKEEYICSKLLVNDDVKEQLLRGGMDQRLATHFAHIMSRDPVYLSQTDISDVNVGDANILDAFQSGVWQHVRLKMPPPDSSDIGWRVEFRPMEVQPRDSENAAFVIFMFLLSRAIIAFDLDFYIPIDKVTESMDAAHKRHAVLSERLWFRKEGWSSERFCSTMCFRQGQTCLCGTSAIARRDSGISVSQDPEYALMSVDKIINGEGESEPVGRAKFPGLIPIILAYLELSGISQNQMIRLSPYLDLVSKRASTQLPTPAHWIRSFVKRHPKYQRDSVVHQEICYDLMKEIVHLGSD